MKTVKSMLYAAVSLALASLTACTATGGYDPAKYRVPDGSKLELTQTLRFPGRSARVYMQFGETVRRSHVNEWEPYCSFGLDRTRDGKPLAREVGPAVFSVRKTHVGVEIAQNSDGEPIVVAGLFGDGGPGGPPWPYRYVTRMELFSEQEPQVDDLTCAVQGAPPDRNLTGDEIRAALGDIARIE